MVGGPSERDAEIWEFDHEPGVGLALTGTVPQRKHIGFPAREVAGVCSASLVGHAIED